MGKTLAPTQDLSPAANDPRQKVDCTLNPSSLSSLLALKLGTLSPDAAAALQQTLGNQGLVTALSSSDPSSAPLTQSQATSVCEDEADEFFRWMDADHDGTLSGSDFNKAIASGTIDQHTDAARKAATVNALKTEAPTIGDLSGAGDEGGIAREDLTAMAGTNPDAAAATSTTMNAYDAYYRRGSSVYPDVTQPGTEGAQAVVAGDVRQGEAGDCAFLAALTSEAAQDPAAVKAMIDANPDGGYGVTFPNGADVAVNAPTTAELQRYAEGGTGGSWPAVMEKAYTRLRADEHDEGDMPLPQESMAGGEVIESATAVFSKDGISDADDLFWTRESTTEQKLSSAFADHRAVTVGIDARDRVFDSAPTQGLSASHAYAVVGYDPTTHLVTVQDPGGQREPEDAKGAAIDGHNDGTFQMSVDEVDGTFDDISYANAPAR